MLTKGSIVKVLKTLHLIALAGFLGSVLTFITIGIAADGASHTFVTTSRDLVLLCTRQLTFPSLTLLIMTGLAMTWYNNPYKPRWIWAKVLLATTMLTNTLLVIEPTISNSIRALSTFNNTAYEDAITRETIYGGINLLICVVLVLLGLARHKRLAPRIS
jgi:uncharacterized membrane protein